MVNSPSYCSWHALIIVVTHNAALDRPTRSAAMPVPGLGRPLTVFGEPRWRQGWQTPDEESCSRWWSSTNQSARALMTPSRWYGAWSARVTWSLGGVAGAGRRCRRSSDGLGGGAEAGL